TEREATSVIAREGVILAGTTEGIFRSDDLGATWEIASTGLTIPHARWMAFHPDVSDFEFAGTEPGAIFVSRDGGTTWRECPEVAQLRDANDWYLPYSPEAGCVRGFAFHGSRGYAAVEVGGLLRSTDRGETWALAAGSSGNPHMRAAPGEIHPDVHSVAIHPSSPDLVFAPTAGGLYHSRDGGTTWTNLYPGCYCRAVWLDPADPDHLIFGPAGSVDRNGRIEETRDGGRTWQAAWDGLDAPWPNRMVERFAEVNGEVLAVLSDGDLVAATMPALRWRQVLPDIPAIAAVAVLQV